MATLFVTLINKNNTKQYTQKNIIDSWSISKEVNELSKIEEMANKLGQEKWYIYHSNCSK